MSKIWQRLIKVVLLAVAIVIYTFQELPEWLPGDETALYILLRFGIFFLALDLALNLWIGLYRRRKGLAPDANDAFILGLRNLYYLTLVGGAIMAVLRVYGVDFGTLFTTLSIVAAAIAIVTREFIAEIISGLFLSFSGQLSVGDYINTGARRCGGWWIM